MRPSLCRPVGATRCFGNAAFSAALAIVAGTSRDGMRPSRLGSPYRVSQRVVAYSLPPFMQSLRRGQTHYLRATTTPIARADG